MKFRSGRSSPVRSVHEGRDATTCRSVYCRHCRRRSWRSSAGMPGHLPPPGRSTSRRRADRTPASRRRRRRSSPSSRPASGRASPPRRRCTPPSVPGTRLRQPPTRDRGRSPPCRRGTARPCGDAATAGCARYDGTLLYDSGTKPNHRQKSFVDTILQSLYE